MIKTRNLLNQGCQTQHLANINKWSNWKKIKKIFLLYCHDTWQTGNMNLKSYKFIKKNCVINVYTFEHPWSCQALFNPFTILCRRKWAPRGHIRVLQVAVMNGVFWHPWTKQSAMKHRVWCVCVWKEGNKERSIWNKTVKCDWIFLLKTTCEILLIKNWLDEGQHLRPVSKVY